MRNQDFFQRAMTKNRAYPQGLADDKWLPIVRCTVVDREAVCLAHLRAAGAIIIGKAKLREVKAGDQDNPRQVFFKHSFSMRAKVASTRSAVRVPSRRKICEAHSRQRELVGANAPRQARKSWPLGERRLIFRGGPAIRPTRQNLLLGPRSAVSRVAGNAMQRLKPLAPSAHANQ